MTHILSRGLLAGAAGTAALNLVSYADMALRGRPPSDLPAQTVEALAHALGRDLPGRGRVRESRRSALGSLSGLGVGLGVGIAASVARAAGLRAPAPIAAVATGAAAMAATDLPMAALDVTDPRTWSGQDWLSDALPHLAYGAVTHVALRRQEPREDLPGPPPTRASAVQVYRSLALGLAAGARSSLGLTGPLLPRTSGVGTAAATAVVGAEMVADKLPIVPGRLLPGPLAMRLVSAAGGAGMLARRHGVRVTLPALAAATGAAAGSLAGTVWREAAAEHMPDWAAAIVEDATALALAAFGCVWRG